MSEEHPPMQERPTMDEIAHREKIPSLWTDKKSATPGYICHDYLRLYEREWGKWRDEPINLMEIGLNKGASIKLWLEYFTNATVIGVDIDLGIINGGGIIRGDTPGIERFAGIGGDAGDENFWSETLKGLLQSASFHVIIDDGCHFSGPIHTAFKCLWPHVHPGGYYVVEDITEVLNPASHTPGFPNQLEFVTHLVNPAIFGSSDIDEIMVSKDLVMVRKKA